ncbi:MAG: DUF4384 domain-containing protein [Desulfobacterales bacterium]|nr:DUF4384 domain-containing protein [Desulfobacterales bacterium]
MKLKGIYSLILILSCILMCCRSFEVQSKESKNLDEAVNLISKDIVNGLKKTEFYDASGKKLPVFISRNYFIDPHIGNNFPFSAYLCEHLRGKLSNTGLFDVITNLSIDTNVFIIGSYYFEGDKLVLHARLRGMKQISENGIQALSDISSSTTSISKKYLPTEWFKEDVKDKMLFLMNSLENKGCDKFLTKKRPSVLVNKFKYQDTKLYSPFSDYISQFSYEYFTMSNFLNLKADVEKYLEDVKKTGKRGMEKTRGILPSQKPGATAAIVSGADYFISGSYWDVSEHEIEIKAELISAQGDALAWSSIKIEKKFVNPALLDIPQKKDDQFMSDLSAFKPNEYSDNLRVEISTQKGRDNLNFRSGESVIFLLKVNKSSYIRIINRWSNGDIYQIYPNTFDDGKIMINPGNVVAIPNKDYSQLNFTIGGELGNEIVIVYASDKFLPEIPGETTEFFGMRKLFYNASGIQKFYEDYAIRNGISLSKDLITIRTTQ